VPPCCWRLPAGHSGWHPSPKHRFAEIACAFNVAVAVRNASAWLANTGCACIVGRVALSGRYSAHRRRANFRLGHVPIRVGRVRQGSPAPGNNPVPLPEIGLQVLRSRVAFAAANNCCAASRFAAREPEFIQGIRRRRQADIALMAPAANPSRCDCRAFKSALGRYTPLYSAATWRQSIQPSELRRNTTRGPAGCGNQRQIDHFRQVQRVVEWLRLARDNNGCRPCAGSTESVPERIRACPGNGLAAP